MGNKSSRAAALGLGAAVGAFAVATMISAAVAPTARADAYSDILADIQAEQADASTAFANAATDGYHTAAGLTQLYIGLDDDIFGVSDDLHVGLIDALTNTPVIPSSEFDFSFAPPTSYAEAVTEAQTYYADGTALTNIIDGLPSSDYGLIALDNDLSAFDQLIVPDQIEEIAGLVYGFPA